MNIDNFVLFFTLTSHSSYKKMNKTSILNFYNVQKDGFKPKPVIKHENIDSFFNKDNKKFKT